MARPQLDPARVAPQVAEQVSSFHRSVVDEVVDAISTNPIVIVGMSQNPFVKKARRILEDANIPFKYLEYGSYFSKWKERLAIKLWAGFPTFPMVFVDGTLIGGYSDLEKLRDSGNLPKPKG